MTIEEAHNVWAEKMKGSQVAQDIILEARKTFEKKIKEWNDLDDMEREIIGDQEILKLFNNDPKIKDAAYNAPLERQAQLYAARIIKAARKNKNIDQDEFDKIEGKALATGRQKYGAGKKKLILSEREVEAIEKHAVPKTTLQLLMKEIDKKFLKQMALPREFNGIAPAKLAQVKRMLNTGRYTIADVADFAGVSTSTIERALKEDRKK